MNVERLDEGKKGREGRRDGCRGREVKGGKERRREVWREVRCSSPAFPPRLLR